MSELKRASIKQRRRSLPLLIIVVVLIFCVYYSIYNAEVQLITTNSSSDVKKRSCFSVRSDFEGPLEGVWKESLDKPPWLELSCKYQPASTSCSYYELPFNNRSLRLSKLRFHPVKCTLEAFNPERFLRSLKSRKLIIAGDSLSQQFFLSLMCRLKDYILQDNVIWGNVAHSQANFCGINRKCMPKVGQHTNFLENYTNPIWAKFEYNVTIRYISIKAEPIKEKLDFISSFSTGSDIMVINKGAWRQKGYKEFAARMQDFRNYYVANKDKLPIVWWRETNPQHFLGPNGDYVPGKRLPSKLKTCAKASPDRLSSSHVDPVNRITNRVMKELEIPVMHTSHAMVSEFDAHLFKSGLDCTHICTPGVDVIWVEYLYNWLKFEHLIISPGSPTLKAHLQKNA